MLNQKQMLNSNKDGEFIALKKICVLRVKVLPVSFSECLWRRQTQTSVKSEDWRVLAKRNSRFDAIVLRNHIYSNTHTCIEFTLCAHDWHLLPGPLAITIETTWRIHFRPYAKSKSTEKKKSIESHLLQDFIDNGLWLLQRSHMHAYTQSYRYTRHMHNSDLISDFPILLYYIHFSPFLSDVFCDFLWDTGHNPKVQFQVKCCWNDQHAIADDEPSRLVTKNEVFVRNCMCNT